MLEHDEDDRYITQAVLDELRADISIHFVSTSTEFFKKLDGNHLPDILLITFRSLPMNAVDILAKLKQSERLAHIPVVILSGVSNASIVNDCYRAGAASFVTKPSTDSDTTSKIRNFVEYWFKTVDLPNLLS